jgi:hypothetical protein
MLRYVWVSPEGTTRSTRYRWVKRFASHHRRAIPLRTLNAAEIFHRGRIGSVTGDN